LVNLIYLFLSNAPHLAIILIGIWFVLQFFDGVASLAQVQQGIGNVAYLAHVGGFITGLVITLLVRPRLRPPAPVSYPPYPHHPYSTGPIGWR